MKQSQIFTDFADEVYQEGYDKEAIQLEKVDRGNVVANYIYVMDDKNILNKPKGDYVTIEFKELSDQILQEEIIDLACEQFHKMLQRMQLNLKKILVVGLGNRFVVSDALGPKVMSELFVTAHYYAYEDASKLKGTRNVAAIQPGVMGQTGIESFDIIKGVVQSFQPDVVILVDALATSNMERINRAIQFNNAGIAPGSGVGNHRKQINAETLQVPVIAIGVATVISVRAILQQVMEKDVLLKNEEQLNSYMVTPKAMDHELKDLTYIVSEMMNRVLHPNYQSL